MKVFLCESLHPAALELLKSRAEVIGSWDRIGEADVIINRNLQLPREVLEKAPQLRVIAIHGTGCDGIDMDYCNAHGITVLYVPFLNADSVAELIVTLSLVLLRKIAYADRLVTSGAPIPNAPECLFGNELGGKTFGLIGCGDIARRVARILIGGFRCRVIGYDPFFSPKAAEAGIEQFSSIDAVLEQADLFSISVHLTKDTANFINAARLAHCKPGALLINTSRGGIVDEKALYDALMSHRLGGAACDVWLHEPPTVENPLVGLTNVIATPHLGANTDEALRRVGVRMVEDIFTVLDGGKAEYVYTKAQL